MIYLKMEILLQKVDFGARYALHLILTRNRRISLRVLKAVQTAYKDPDMRNHIMRNWFGCNEKSSQS